MLTSIIIPTVNALPLLEGCLAAIHAHTQQEQTPYEIVVVDNGSTDETARWCASRQVRLLSLPDNRGFTAACNLGMRASAGEALLLLNNDVTVTPGWLVNLQRALVSSQDVGMVGPVTNYVSGRQQVEHASHDRETLVAAAALNNVSDPSRWEVVRRLIGFCLLFKRQLYQELGELDERFSPGHYEDDDYCLRAHLAGYRLLMCKDVLVHHEGSASFRQQRANELQALVARNRQLYIDKWNLDPAQFM